MHYATLVSGFFQLSITCLRATHTFGLDSLCFCLFFWVTFHHRDISWLVHLFTSWQTFIYSIFFSTVNKAPVKIHIQAFVWLCGSSSLGQTPRHGTTGLFGNPKLYVWLQKKLSGWFPTGGCHWFAFLPAKDESSRCSMFLPAVDMIGIFTEFISLNCSGWGVVRAFPWHPVMPSSFSQTLCSFGIHLFPSVKCLFKSFIHFIFQIRMSIFLLLTSVNFSIYFLKPVFH